MAACVEVWESDPEAFHYHGSGYIALGPPVQEGDLIEVHERQQRIGYPSELYLGEEEVTAHMRSLYPDWRAPGITVCLHEQAGGYAFNRESMFGLADKARAAGAEIIEGVEVTGFEFDGAGRRDLGRDDAPARSRSSRSSSPWVRGSRRCGSCSGSPTVSTCVSRTERRWRISRCGPTGTSRRERSLVDPATFVTADGRSSAVIHLDSDQPLRDDDGRLITDEPWGDLLQARPLERPGRRGAAPPREHVRGRPVPHGHGRARLPRHVVRGAVPLPRTVRRDARRSTARRARGEPGRSPSTTSRCSITCAPTSTSPPIRTTATR